MDDEMIHGAWRVVGESFEVRDVPVAVNGFGRPVVTTPLTVRKIREVRHRWARVEDEYRETES